MKHFNNALYAIYGYDLVKYDSEGNLIWKKDVANGKTVFLNMKRAFNDHIYIYYHESGGPYLIQKYDTSGNLIWSKPGGSGYLLTDTEGSLYITGEGRIKKTNQNFDTEWITYIDRDSMYVARGLIENDTIYVCGNRLDNGEIKTGIFLFSAKTGAFITSYLFDFYPDKSEYATHIVKNGNDFYLAGRWSPGSEPPRPYIAKVTFNTPTAIEEKKKETGFSIYPNPSGGVFTVQFSSSQASTPLSLTVKNVLGQEVYNSKPPLAPPLKGGELFTIDLSTHGKGVYFVEVRSGEAVETKKIVVQ